MPIVPAGEPAQRMAELLRARPSLTMPARVAGAATGDPSGPGPGSPVPWPAGQLAEILSARRSVRTFSAEPVTGDQVTQIVATARAAWRHALPAPYGRSDLEVLVAARAVSELAPRVYRWTAGAGSRQVAGQGLVVALAEQYVAAPAILLICGHLYEPGEPGTAGYAAALVRAGALGYAMLLAAVSVGLAGCPYGGSSLPARRAAHGATAGASHLFTVAIGNPADAARAGGEIAPGDHA
jgi:nitroreductase